MASDEVRAGRVEGLHIASHAGGSIRQVDVVHAIPGVGLEGDRYALGLGHYSQDRRVSRDLTLIEGEVIDDLAFQLKTPIDSGATRRNVTTLGIRLDSLVGKRFRIGTVLCEGTRICEPCQYLVGLLGIPILQGLVHRGGLRANILTEGYIRLGDSLVIKGF